MKIAITAEKKDIKSDVCPTVGRAPFFLIFEDKKLVKTIKNPFAVGGGGAGLSVAQMLFNEGVNMIIGGKFGPNVVSALAEKNMTYKEVTGKSIEDVIGEI